MGAWGEGPFDNDSAFESLGDFFKEEDPFNMFNYLKGMINDKDPLVIRAGIEILIAALDKRLPSLIGDSIEKLDIIRGDKNFLNGWKDPKKVRKTIQSQLRRLRRKARQQDLL